MICAPCRRGKHNHDRHTGRAPGTRRGDDAGCPNLATPGDLNSDCTCDVVLEPLGTGRKHCQTCTCGGGR